MKYTKNELIEAIKYWEHQLKFIVESKSPILNMLEKTFGHERIFNDKIDFIPTSDIMILLSIFDIIR